LIPKSAGGRPQAAQPQETEQDEPAAAVGARSAWWSFSFYAPLLVLAVVYVPGTLLVTSPDRSPGRFGAVFERDYSPWFNLHGDGLGGR